MKYVIAVSVAIFIISFAMTVQSEERNGENIGISHPLTKKHLTIIKNLGYSCKEFYTHWGTENKGGSYPGFWRLDCDALGPAYDFYDDGRLNVVFPSGERIWYQRVSGKYVRIK